MISPLLRREEGDTLWWRLQRCWQSFNRSRCSHHYCTWSPTGRLTTAAGLLLLLLLFTEPVTVPTRAAAAGLPRKLHASAVLPLEDLPPPVPEGRGVAISGVPGWTDDLNLTAALPKLPPSPPSGGTTPRRRPPPSPSAHAPAPHTSSSPGVTTPPLLPSQHSSFGQSPPPLGAMLEPPTQQAGSAADYDYADSHCGGSSGLPCWLATSGLGAPGTIALVILAALLVSSLSCLRANNLTAISSSCFCAASAAFIGFDGVFVLAIRALACCRRRR